MRVGVKTWQTLAVMVVLTLAGCDAQKIENLEVGVSTEAQVREKWGMPEATFAEPDGSVVLEYPRQPAGQKNYMIVIGSDGTLKSIRQVLNAETIANIKPGMMKDEVRRLVGRSAKTLRYDLKPNEEVWEWRWADGQQSKVLTVVFGANGQVTSVNTQPDKTPDLPS